MIECIAHLLIALVVYSLVGGTCLYFAGKVTGIQGPWEQSAEPIYGRDGGHGMLFRDFDQRLWMTLHHPNKNPNERPLLLEVEAFGNGLTLKT